MIASTPRGEGSRGIHEFIRRSAATAVIADIHPA